MKLRTILTALILLVGSGCLTLEQMMAIRAPFIESEFEPYLKSGDCVITGQAFLKTQGGDVKFGAGNEVVLLPVTPYTTEIRRRSTINNEEIGPVNPLLDKYRRTTRADGNGNFEFKGLPPGEYYASCAIYWSLPGRYAVGTTGGIAYGTAKVNPGETVKVVVTR